jgi:hypothetical protein
VSSNETPFPVEPGATRKASVYEEKSRPLPTALKGGCLRYAGNGPKESYSLLPSSSTPIFASISRGQWVGREELFEQLVNRRLAVLMFLLCAAREIYPRRLGGDIGDSEINPFVAHFFYF